MSRVHYLKISSLSKTKCNVTIVVPWFSCSQVKNGHTHIRLVNKVFSNQKSEKDHFDPTKSRSPKDYQSPINRIQTIVVVVDFNWWMLSLSSTTSESLKSFLPFCPTIVPCSHNSSNYRTQRKNKKKKSYP